MPKLLSGFLAGRITFIKAGLVALVTSVALGTTAAQAYSEDFEGGTLPAGWSVPAGYAGGFSVTSASARNGTYSLQSDPVGIGQSAAIELTLTSLAGELTLHHMRHAAPYAKFRVYVNGNLEYTSTNHAG